MQFKDKWQNSISLIQQVYQADTRPWIIGYSGGKDSTAVVQLIFEALSMLPKQNLNKDIYVISSNTLIETPLILAHINDSINQINVYSKKNRLPITATIVTPKLENSFWATLIGKGYPSPRQKFRWCTDRLKIEPSNRFIKETVSRHGEVIVILGVRKSESASRAQTLANHKIGNKLLRKHSTLPNAYVLAPIEDFTVDDVWTYLLKTPSPWGGDNHSLLSLYKDSSGECPLVIDKDTPSCGNSRFGCWVCTVVKEDKALIGFIENGHEELIPLLQFRNWLTDIRNNPNYREKRRQNGSVYYIGSGDDRRIGLGPFTLEARKEILKNLLSAQRDYGSTLISEEELKLISQIWIEWGDWERSVPDIYDKILGQALDWPDSERPLYSKEEIKLLDSLCKKHDVPLEIVHKLLRIQENHYGFKYRYGIYKDIHKALSEDWLHIEEENEVYADDY
jgi:DNA sulfur modification protein DndC